MEANTITNESNNDYYDNQIQAVENDILSYSSKISRLKIKLNDLKRQRNLHKESAQRRRIAEIFIHGS
jgi:septal ring factor EnvC (AmiA/AmiB activator)